eukprot:NODE_554_length_1550_cov_252.945370_g416_i0.p1 GENE.NODE_554_length_1550_cov_252.945370_g416_i0~~NODE_554_length_1550_cov_252.945370_g416_i0.p1  ORF type:complete len:458 (-),score=102.54 NODE_554_length_1550_cov_252.945370_g416_i0:175-1494(-)
MSDWDSGGEETEIENDFVDSDAEVDSWKPHFKEYAPMVVLPYTIFKAKGRFIRSSEGDAVEVSSLSKNSVIVFISHRWLRPHMDPTIAHPDNEKNEKHGHIILGLEKFFPSTEEHRRLYLWIDFACIDQDDNNLKGKGIKSLPAYIEKSHLTLTPIVDNDWRSWFQKAPVSNYWSHFQSPPWKEYTSRGWCRLEAFITSNTKPPPGFNFFEYFVASSHRRDRPHVLYGSWHKGENQRGDPLPALQNSFLNEYNPKDGQVTDSSDIAAIEALMSILPEAKQELGYVGPKNAQGKQHGMGREVFKTGQVYEGMFSNGRMHGHGKLLFSSGAWYEGDFQNGNMNGKGKYCYADGNWQEGDFKDGGIHGHGIAVYTDGIRYEGAWKDDSKHGNGKYFYVDGSSYEGMFENGTKNGPGVFITKDGATHDRVYKNNKMISDTLRK